MNEYLWWELDELGQNIALQTRYDCCPFPEEIKHRTIKLTRIYWYQQMTKTD